MHVPAEWVDFVVRVQPDVASNDSIVIFAQ